MSHIENTPADPVNIVQQPGTAGVNYTRTRDDGPAWVSGWGVGGARFQSANQSATPANVTDAPTVGQKLVITSVLVSVAATITVDLKEETTGTIIATMYMGNGAPQQWTPRGKLKLATTDKRLQVQTSAAGNIAVTAEYYSEP